jgi:hypothetical protein
MPDTVTVPEVRPAIVSRRTALRLFLGKLVVDFVETFAGLAVAIIGINFVLPLNVEGWQLLAVQLAGPASAALLSSLRRAWPVIRGWLTGEEK